MKISQLRSVIYKKVWHSPKSRLSGFLRGKCEEIPQKHRLKVVTILFTVFLLTAFFVFGHACYRLGLGHRPTVEVQHIQHLDIPTSNASNPVGQ